MVFLNDAAHVKRSTIVQTIIYSPRISRIGIFCHQLCHRAAFQEKKRMLWAFQWSELNARRKPISSCDDPSWLAFGK